MNPRLIGIKCKMNKHYFDSNNNICCEGCYRLGIREERERILKIIEKFSNRFHFMVDDLTKEIEWETKTKIQKEEEE